VLISLTSGKHNEAASIVNTDPDLEPTLDCGRPEFVLLMLIFWAKSDERLLVLDNKPGEQVQLLHWPLDTLVMAIGW